VEAAALAARLNEVIVIFISIVLQSLPFVLVGVFASAVVQQYLTGRLVARWMPRRPLPAVLLGSLCGLLVPVCDCGAIPLARRLTAKGVPVYAALSLLLAAPVVNPIVIAATAFAFQGNVAVVGLRVAMTLSVAISVGLLASVLFADARLRLPGLAERLLDPDKDEATAPGRPASVVRHASAELFDIFFFIVLGALFTAVVQTFVPRTALASFGAHPIASVLALMPTATVLSICSEADAFVARAFASSFSPGAVLAFMTIGQIVDIRNGLLLFRTLGPRLVGLIVGVGYGLVLLEGVAINALLVHP
jgi:uncharacterized membrane protein YraQ (UPF0718 family)